MIIWIELLFISSSSGEIIIAESAKFRELRRSDILIANDVKSNKSRKSDISKAP